jgi:hypothetical protein
MIDLWAPVSLLDIPAFKSVEDFRGHFFDNDTLYTMQYRAFLQSIALRREKTEIWNGKPLLQLPPLSTSMVPLKFTTTEQLAYDKVMNDLRLELQRADTANAPVTESLVTRLLRARRICDHLDLDTKQEIRHSTKTRKVVCKFFCYEALNCFHNTNQHISSKLSGRLGLRGTKKLSFFLSGRHSST